MFKLSVFGVDSGSQRTLPLINGVIHSALFQSTPHGDKTLSQRYRRPPHSGGPPFRDQG